MGGSLGCFRALSGGSAPDAGLAEPHQGTSGHFHTNPVAAVKTAAVAELADATNASTHLRIAPKAAA